jgi:hypothetical protein
MQTSIHLNHNAGTPYQIAAGEDGQDARPTVAVKDSEGGEVWLYFARAEDLYRFADAIHHVAEGVRGRRERAARNHQAAPV